MVVGEWAMWQWREVDDVAAVDVSAVWPGGGGGGSSGSGSGGSLV